MMSLFLWWETTMCHCWRRWSRKLSLHLRTTVFIMMESLFHHQGLWKSIYILTLLPLNQKGKESMFPPECGAAQHSLFLHSSVRKMSHVHKMSHLHQMPEIDICHLFLDTYKILPVDWTVSRSLDVIHLGPRNIMAGSFNIMENIVYYSLAPGQGKCRMKEMTHGYSCWKEPFGYTLL